MINAVIAATIVALVGVAGLAACAKPGTTPPGSVILPSGTALVAKAERVGGFVPPGYLLIEPPTLAVYSDGRAIADAKRVLMLDQTELTSLVASLRDNLAGLGPTVTAGAEQHVADAPTSVIRVLEADGSMRVVSAYALGIGGNYPGKLIAADKAMNSLAERVLRDGADYTSTQIRVVATDRNDSGPGPVQDWPAGVPVPPLTAKDSITRAIDLDGAAATAMIKVVPEPVAGGVWPVLRTPEGLLLGVAWRYLLPDEPLD